MWRFHLALLSNLKAALTVLAISILQSCMSVPMATMAKLAPLSPLEADPAEIRVAILAPEELTLKKGDVILTVDWSPDMGTKKQLDTGLEVVTGNEVAPTLVNRLKAGQKLNVLQLDTVSVANFRTFQAEVIAAKANGVRGRGRLAISFSGACWTVTFPTDGRRLPFDPFIKVDHRADYMPLFTGADIKDLLKQAKIQTLPTCSLALPKGPRLN